MNGLFGLPLLADPVPLSPIALRLVSQGIAALWARIVTADGSADSRPLLLSYDIHPTPQGPVLIEVNTNAGGVLTAMQAARDVNQCCGDWEQEQLETRLLALFRRDLLGDAPGASAGDYVPVTPADPQRAGVVAIVDDELASQPLLAEMQALAALMRPFAQDVRVVDARELAFSGGQLRHGDTKVDRVYWRSTDFLLAEPRHEAVHKALEAGAISLAPSPEAYRAIADKRRFIEWSLTPELAHDNDSGCTFMVAETVRMSSRSVEAWHAARKEWVFKPASGYASRGVYVGKSISRQKLAELPAADYLAQRYAPHPVVDRHGQEWKYDLRFFADRGHIIGAAARVFQGQVVGMRTPGSGFAPIRVGSACCLIGALGTATSADTNK